jgi:MerR family transcriptional regulator, copper efflux regulator
MLIGELSVKTGLSKDTIRFYEKLGLIKAGERKAGTRTYREFSLTTVNRLGLIQQAKKLGFKLGEMKQTLDSWESGALSIEEKIKIIQQKMTHVDAQVAQLEEIKSYLFSKLVHLQQESSRAFN